ncbi:MAG: hypothetical protein NC094_04800 [Bacteroidales bacterium]|nr:hypothetical protein [Bacteroidales bacterium]
MFPTVEEANRILKRNKTNRPKKEYGIFTNEEILALGLHPDDEGYKMGLISMILGGK